MERRHVVGGVADAGVRQSGDDAIAVGRTRDEEVVDVARLVLRQVHELAEPKLRISRDSCAATFCPAVELLEEDAQERRLQLVEARVVADEVEVDLVARAVESENA